jgi:CheY-like chemotaxis protein
MDHRRVLVVDDDPIVRRMLTTVFRQKSLHVDEAEDGQNAIALLGEHAYAVILLDLLMPHTNGFHVLDAMRSDVPAPPVVLVITGAEREVVAELDPQRIHGVIRKPFDPDEVAAIVATCTDLRAKNVLGTMAVALTNATLLAMLANQV